MITVLGVDIGKSGGICVSNNKKTIFTKAIKIDNFLEFFNFIKEVIEKYKVNCIITGKPNRFYNIILKHAQYIGVLSLIATIYNIPLVIESDTTIRKQMLGTGNGQNKEMVHEKYKGETADVSDSIMFAKYILEKQK